MTINMLSDAIKENYEHGIKIGKEKRKQGVSREVLEMRLRTFKDLTDWIDAGRPNRLKIEMEHLLGRSERFIVVIDRLEVI